MNNQIQVNNQHKNIPCWNRP